MKSPSRVFSMCMFCGAPEVTREHIFGSGLSKKFPPIPIAIKKFRHNFPLESLSAKQQKIFYRKGGDHALSKTSKCMCEVCNHTLGKELSVITSSLESVMKGNTNIIQEKHRRLFIRYFQRIAAIYDLETSCIKYIPATESAADTEFNRVYHTAPPNLRFEERKSFRDGDFLDRVGVYVGRHMGSYGKTYFLNIASKNAVLKDGSRINAQKRITVSIGKLTCLLAIGAPNSNPKLTRLDMSEGNFKLNPRLSSSDDDVDLNMEFVDGPYPRDAAAPFISIEKLNKFFGKN